MKSMNPMDAELSRIMQLNDGDLVKTLCNYLQDKRYFIILDDLWNLEDWNTLSPAFPKGKRGSKVLLTTRNKEVASVADPWSLQLELGTLNDEDSWKLLCKHAFHMNMGDSKFYPAGLEKLGKEMVRRCGGLPLAICILGGVLATKREEIKEWEHVNRDITSNIDEGLMGILAFCYNDLPAHLKPCFLYLGLFPEDYAIPRKKLIQMWIAEGFISHTKEEDALSTLEAIAKHEYYSKLIQRCMIQTDKDTTPGMGKTCRVHDLIRDFCVAKAKEIKLLDIYNNRTDGVRANSSGTNERLRRYAIHLSDQANRYDDFYFNTSSCALRTLVVSYGNSLTIKYEHIKLLRVLDLGKITTLNPDIIQVVSELVHLRYLELGCQSHSEITEISSSIGNLRNLQTLKLNSFRGVLPATISNLAQLRHLKIRAAKFAKSFRIEKLTNLQTFNYVKGGKWIRKGCLGKLLNLQVLRVYNASQTETDVLLHEILNTKSLSSPDDQNQNPIRVLDLDCMGNFDNNIFESLSCFHSLHQLMLRGGLSVLNLQKYPLNLSKLKLSFSNLLKDPMESLQHLPNLKSLDMHKAYLGKEMVCSAKGFPQLQLLRLSRLELVKNWRIDQGGMPHLKELQLRMLTELNMLPEGLRFITTLEKLEVDAMPRIRDRVAREVGEDWYKVQHISVIKIENHIVSTSLVVLVN